ncbi:MAG: twin-arginine translocase subunit TatC [Sutterellaceae bacterium]|nr:twin-arginine translocase subunit TatC [Sutterellaceae bacterium]MDD7442377.1 twin-arginine translocase subunit TatC [Sutterellaceae bacterium]MDY2867146.1 twin-arginine translocase subunit TatC [Mesosutterella sp.]
MSEKSDQNLPIEAPDDPRNEKPLVEHLVELRNRIVKSVIAILVVFLVLSPFMKQLFDGVSMPLMIALPEGTKMLSTGVVAPFLVPLKVTLFLAFVIALPVVLYQIWAYIAPALYRQEKRLVLPVLVSSTAMFYVGVLYCYFVVFRFVFRFIAQFSPESVNFAPDIDSYFSFVLSMFVAFGVTFEVPIIVMVLNHVGIASLAALKKARPYVIVGAFVLAAIFTPPDVLSQTLLALPLVLLYQAGIWLVQCFGKKNPRSFMDQEREEIAELEKQEQEREAKEGKSS